MRHRVCRPAGPPHCQLMSSSPSVNSRPPDDKRSKVKVRPSCKRNQKAGWWRASTTRAKTAQPHAPKAHTTARRPRGSAKSMSCCRRVPRWSGRERSGFAGEANRATPRRGAEGSPGRDRVRPSRPGGAPRNRRAPLRCSLRAAVPLAALAVRHRAPPLAALLPLAPRPARRPGRAAKWPVSPRTPTSRRPGRHGHANRGEGGRRFRQPGGRRNRSGRCGCWGRRCSGPPPKRTPLRRPRLCGAPDASRRTSAIRSRPPSGRGRTRWDPGH